MTTGSKSYGRVINGPVQVDRTAPYGAGVTSLYVFTTPKTTVIKNYGGVINNLTLKATGKIGTDIGGRCFIGNQTITSYATTTTSANSLGITGANRRTIFVRFKANASSGGGNLGGLFTCGDTTGNNSMLAVHQVSDGPNFISPDQWCVDLGSTKLYFIVPNTANKIHDIVVTYDGTSSITVYVDGSPLGQFQGTLATTASAAFDVGRWINPNADTSINYFGGAIFMIGTVNYDWEARAVRLWHIDPFRILRPKRSTLPSSGSNFSPNITLTGLPALGGLGTVSFNQSPPGATLIGLPALGGLGTIFIANTSNTAFIQLTGLPSLGDIGTITALRDGFSDPLAPAGGTWTPVQPVAGG